MKKVNKSDAIRDQLNKGNQSPTAVVKALKAKGITVDKRRIELEEPIKRLGTHTVRVKLFKDVTVGLTVEVQGPLPATAGAGDPRRRCRIVVVDDITLASGGTAGATGTTGAASDPSALSVTLAARMFTRAAPAGATGTTVVTGTTGSTSTSSSTLGAWTMTWHAASQRPTAPSTPAFFRWCVYWPAKWRTLSRRSSIM